MLRYTDYDVVVVGAGPSGANAARFAAAGGLRVLLVDRKAELGVPTECSGAVSARGLASAEVPLADEYIICSVAGFLTYSNEGEPWRVDYRELAGRESIGFVVDRRRLDTYVAGLATDAGAELALRTEVDAVERRGPDSGDGWRVQLRHLGTPMAVTARVLVAADGVGSRLGKWLRINTTLPMHEAASCVQYEMTNVPTDRLLEIVVGQNHAPGGYVWVFPTAPGRAKVGLGVIRTMTDEPAGRHLDRFIGESFMRDRFRRAAVTEVSIGIVPLARPLPRPYADGVLLVGDAARNVNGLTGGGIHTALLSGRVAGESLAALWDRGDFSRAGLAAYGDAWDVAMGGALQKVYDLKTSVFRLTDPVAQDRTLYQVLGGYFHPSSEFRKR
jgi:digeranylgeranylglycerophospholipid reductase